MKKVVLILLILTGIGYGYFEQNDGVPGIYSADGSQHWLLWSGNVASQVLFDDSVGIMFDDSFNTIVVGKFTPGVLSQDVTVMGYDAGKQNSRAGQSAFGARAGFKNNEQFQAAFGLDAGTYNHGFEQNCFGDVAGYFNTGDNQVAMGFGSGRSNDGDKNTSIGNLSFNIFGLDTGSAQAITSVDFANNQVTISGGHGFGANGVDINLKATTTGTLPTGLFAGPDIWDVVSSTVLECVTTTFTDGGSGTHTLTPQFIYTNSTAIGYNAEPDASNQVMLGDTNITDVKTFGSITAPSATLDSLTIDNSGGTDAVITMDGSSNDAATLTYESDNALFILSKDLLLSTVKKLFFRDSAIGIYSQADTFMDLFADGAVRIGNSSAGAPTTYIAVEPDADTYWVGAGTGLPYGHIYVDGTQSIIIALTVNTPAEVLDDGTTSSGDGWLAGEMNLVTFPTGGDEHYMSITKAGVYSVTWDLSFNMASPGANVEIHGGMAVDGTPVRDKGEGHRTIANNSDTGNMGGTLIIDCPNGTEQISLWLENTTNNSDVTAIHGNINIMMVGGT